MEKYQAALLSRTNDKDTDFTGIQGRKIASAAEQI